ncbi:MAG: tetratricopeptide repeat protein [Proteobacteria bacterium]|nr:tetratricopeptide repeat protein [Pseudomonadota bacterium]
MSDIVRQTLQLDEALRQAIAHHRAGHLQDAERLYRAILHAHPNHPDANHSLGVLAGQAGQYAVGLRYLKTALAADPGQGQYALSYAEALLATGQTKDALTILQTAVQRGLSNPAAIALRERVEAAALGELAAEFPGRAGQAPQTYSKRSFSTTGLPNATRNPEMKAKSAKLAKPRTNIQVSPKSLPRAEFDRLVSLFNTGRYAEMEDLARAQLEKLPGSGMAWKALGTALQMQGKDALAVLRKAAELSPRDAEAHCNLGNAERDHGRIAEAVASYRRALEIHPHFAMAYNNLGNALRELRQYEGAVFACRRALEIQPDYADAHSNLGAALQDIGHLDLAITSCRRALTIEPDLGLAYTNLGVALSHQDKLDVAVACFHRALSFDPHCAETHRNLAMNLSDQDRLDDALMYIQRALFIDPHNIKAKFSRAVVLLSKGILSEGWVDYEYRFVTTDKRIFSHRQWAGENLRDKSILIWGDQGIGDEIQFASMYAEMTARAGRCVIECAAKLQPLFARTFPGAQVVPKSDPPHSATLDNIDYQCAAGSLGRWLRPVIEYFPRHRGYLTTNPERVDYWKTRLAKLGPGLKVGFCWRSSRMIGRLRLHCTLLDQWGPIFAIPGIHLVNLQYDECSAELDEARRRFGVPLHAFPEVDLFDDLDEASALTQALDLVISVWTASASLAAAVGVPTWMMSYGREWGTHGTDYHPWYPTVRYFPRTWDQSWDTTIEKIAGLLKETVSVYGGTMI